MINFITEFKLKVYQSTGEAYQKLFTDIMMHKDVDFKKVSSHGNIGDRGNDGWCSTSGKYYQVYAPKDLLNNKKATDKMVNDFEKLKSYWDNISKIKEYYFVVNDKFHGVPPHMYQISENLKLKYNLDKVDIVTSDELVIWFMSLNDETKHIILGGDYLAIKKSDNFIEFYKNIVCEISEKMHLDNWANISDSLTMYRIRTSDIDSFSEVSLLVSLYNFPNTNFALEQSILELIKRVSSLISHFKDSEFGCLDDSLEWWHRDGSWKRDFWYKQGDDYNRLYDKFEKWMIDLDTKHYNLAHAISLYAHQVRNSVDSMYYMRCNFPVIDCDKVTLTKDFQKES